MYLFKNLELFYFLFSEIKLYNILIVVYSTTQSFI